MAEKSKSSASAVSTQLGKTIGAALKSSSFGNAIAKTLIKQIDIGKLTKTIDSLSQSASTFKSAIKSLSGGNGSGAPADVKTKTSELQGLTAATKEADSSMEIFKANLEKTAGDDSSAMGMAIQSFEKMIETNESLQKQIEETKNVYDLLGKIVETSSKKSATSTTASAAKQVAANTTATASNGAKAVSGATANSMMLPPPLNVIALGTGIAAIVGALAMLSGGPKAAGVSGSAPKGSMPSSKGDSKATPPPNANKQGPDSPQAKGGSPNGKEEKTTVSSVRENTVAVKALTTSIIKQGKLKAEEPSPENSSPDAEQTTESEPASKPTAEQKEKKNSDSEKKEPAKRGTVAESISKLANFNPGKSIQNAILGPMKSIAAPFAGIKGAIGELKGLKMGDIKQRLNPFAGFKEAFRTQVLGKPPSEPQKTAEQSASAATKKTEAKQNPEGGTEKTSELKPLPPSQPVEPEPAKTDAAPAAASPEPPEAAKTAVAASSATPSEPKPPSRTSPPLMNGAAAKKEAAAEVTAIKSKTAAQVTAQNAEKQIHKAKMDMLSEEKSSQAELMEQTRTEAKEKTDILETETKAREKEFTDKKTKNKGILGFLKAEGMMDEWKTKLTIKNHAKELASSAKKFAQDAARTAKSLVTKAASAAAGVVKWAFNLPFPLNIAALAAGGAAVAGGVLWARSMLKGGGGNAPSAQNPGEPKEEGEETGPQAPSPESVKKAGEKGSTRSMGSSSLVGMMLLSYERQKKDTLNQMLSLMKSIDTKIGRIHGGGGLNIINQEGGGEEKSDDKATNPSDPFKPFRYATNLTR